MNQRFGLPLFILVANLLGVPLISNATLIGVDVTVQTTTNSSVLLGQGPFTQTVSNSATPEFDFSGGACCGFTQQVVIDISDSTIDIDLIALGSTSLGTGAYFEFQFSGLEWFGVPGSSISGVNVLTNTTGSSLVTTVTGANSFTTRILNGSIDTTKPEALSLQVLPNHAAIPEPSTMLLFGSGLAGLIGWKLRKNKAA